MQEIKRVLLCLFVLCLLSSNREATAGGQHEFGSVARIQSSTGEGTCFAVAETDSEVEVWTAAHCQDGIGTASTIVWETGEQTKAVTAYENKRGRNDVAKLVGPKPSHKLNPLAVLRRLPVDDDWRYHAGYGNSSRQTARAIYSTNGKFTNRYVYRPTALAGDSGGPVQNENGQVIGVVVERTMEGDKSRLLAQPISGWLNFD